jgi:hypothetical protein
VKHNAYSVPSRLIGEWVQPLDAAIRPGMRQRALVTLTTLSRNSSPVLQEVKSKPFYI